MVVVFLDEVIDIVGDYSRLLGRFLQYFELSSNSLKCLMISLDILDPLVDRCLSC